LLRRRLIARSSSESGEEPEVKRRRRTAYQPASACRSSTTDCAHKRDWIKELLAEGVALGEEGGERGLRWSAERKISVGDDFEALESRPDKGVRAGDGEPGDFHLWECGDFRDAAEGKGEDF